jgi:hypothetical protein
VFDSAEIGLAVVSMVCLVLIAYGCSCRVSLGMVELAAVVDKALAHRVLLSPAEVGLLVVRVQPDMRLLAHRRGTLTREGRHTTYTLRRTCWGPFRALVPVRLPAARCGAVLPYVEEIPRQDALEVDLAVVRASVRQHTAAATTGVRAVGIRGGANNSRRARITSGVIFAFIIFTAAAPPVGGELPSHVPLLGLGMDVGLCSVLRLHNVCGVLLHRVEIRPQHILVLDQSQRAERNVLQQLNRTV